MTKEINGFLDGLESELRIYQPLFEQGQKRNVYTITTDLRRLREQYLIETETHKTRVEQTKPTPKLSTRTWEPN